MLRARMFYSVNVDNTVNGITCSGNATMTFTVNPAETVTLNNDTICDNASAIFTPSSSNNPSTYLWSDGSAASSLTVNQAGTYTVTITDASGCKGTASATLTTISAPALSITNNLSNTSDSISVCKN